MFPEYWLILLYLNALTGLKHKGKYTLPEECFAFLNYIRGGAVPIFRI